MLLVSFVPTVLHIWLLYVWFWHLLALWMAPGAVQQCSRQAPAAVRVCTFIWIVLLSALYHDLNTHYIWL